MRATVVVALVLLFACPLGQSLQPVIGPVRAEAAQSDIDTLLAPIALYPDALLAQILMCAGDPASVRRLDEWLKVQTLKGSELQDEAVLANFEASFVALAVFPQVVRMMAEKLDWTKMLGEVFAADKTAVFASIQRLRAQARQVGTLQSNEQQQVETQTTSSGEQVIVIEPTNPQVVYVPQYNPTVVYTTPPTTVVVQQTSSADAVAAGMIGFTAGIVIGAAVNNSYYYGPYGWHGGGYMYNDAWDDYYDHREDARDDWQDHREDLAEERGDRRENASEQRTERAGERSDRAQSGQQQRTERQENRPATSQQSARSTQAQSAQSGATQQRTQRTSTANTEARGKTTSTQRATPERSGTKSDAFSGYSSGKSQRAASSRGQSSRGGSRGGGGRRR
jgi:hypothetical protein